MMNLFATLLIQLFSVNLAMAVEEPKYQVIDQFSGIEVRQLSGYWVVSIELEGDESQVGNDAFRPLLGYISGENEVSEKISMTAPVTQSKAPSEKIAMTAPVTQEKSGTGKFTVSFVLPAEYLDKTPPKPKNPKLSLRKWTDRKIAVLKYSGRWTTERFHEKRDELLKAIQAQKKWTQAGEPIWARFDPPFMPWFLRRNEVQVEVK